MPQPDCSALRLPLSVRLRVPGASQGVQRMRYLLRLRPCVARVRSHSAAFPRQGMSSVVGGGKYDGFQPGREWVPLDTNRIKEGEARRAEARRRRRRWERSQRQSSGAAIEVVCHGNIARSQVFAHYLDAFARACRIPLAIRSCGVAEEAAYSHWPELVAETERRLAAVTPPGVPPPRIERDWWSPPVAARVPEATLILAADASIQSALVAKLGPAAPPVLLFYEFSGDGTRDFVDTFDPSTGGQDPERYSNCFDTLEGMAAKAIADLEQQLETQEANAEAEALVDDGVARALLALVAARKPK